MTDRIETCNSILSLFAPDTTLYKDGNYVCVRWVLYNGKEYKRRWMTRGQDFYPVWHHKWAHGGTRCVALSQLVRWCQNKPVLPLSTWEYWCSEQIGLAKGHGATLALKLFAGGYPTVAFCVLCGRDLSGMDWWSLNGVSGPCCHYNKGCRQRGGDER